MRLPFFLKFLAVVGGKLFTAGILIVADILIVFLTVINILTAGISTVNISTVNILIVNILIIVVAFTAVSLIVKAVIAVSFFKFFNFRKTRYNFFLIAESLNNFKNFSKVQNILIF